MDRLVKGIFGKIKLKQANTLIRTVTFESSIMGNHNLNDRVASICEWIT
jgi:hypothetical protein